MNNNNKLLKEQQYELIQHLTQNYGDAGVYLYNGYKIEIAKLKTTMSIKWTRTNNGWSGSEAS